MSATHAVMHRLDEDRGPRGYSGRVLSMHRDATSAIEAARTSAVRPVDAIRLPTKTAVGRTLYYGKRFILVSLGVRS